VRGFAGVRFTAFVLAALLAAFFFATDFVLDAGFFTLPRSSFMDPLSRG
jgi:hypothetical protein